MIYLKSENLKSKRSYPKFSIKADKNKLKIFRNNKLELSFHTTNVVDLELYLNRIFPKDFFEYVEFEGRAPNTPLHEWLQNVLFHDEEGRSLFKKVVVVS